MSREMADRVLYIELDPPEMTGDELEDNYKLNYCKPVIFNILETAYKHVGCGMESDRHLTRCSSSRTGTITRRH